MHALRTDDGGKRSAVLSGAAPTLHEAFEDLHRKSAQAVDRYVAVNGFDAGPERASTRRRGRKRRRGQRTRSHDASTDGSSSERSHSSSSSLTASSVSGSASDSGSSPREEADGQGSVEAPGKPSGRKHNNDRARPRKPPGLDLSKPRAFGEPGSMQPPWYAGLPPDLANKTGPPSRPRPMDLGPPPGWPAGRLPVMGAAVGTGNHGKGSSTSKIMGHLPRPPPPLKGPGAWPAMHHVPMPTAPPVGPPTRRPVILTIDWESHGQATFADACVLSVAAVQGKTRELLTSRLSEFNNVSPHHYPGGRWIRDCSVEVRKVRVDAQVFLTTGPGDCLATVVESVGPAPRVVHVFVDVYDCDRGDDDEDDTDGLVDDD